MNYQAKLEVVRRFRKAYDLASKREKTRMLDTIVETTGYSRKHAIALLNDPPQRKKTRRVRASRYAHLYDTLKFVWATSNFLCGKRLKPFLPELLQSLKRHKEIQITPDDTALLLTVSAATIDRLLARARRECATKGRSTTKPGTLLKHQIPIRTFADWDDTIPGFLQIDLVAHCGDTVRGEYINTLDITDVSTGWTVCAAFMGKSDRFCSQAIEEARSLIPFPILGIDSDNGSEFINKQFMRYCERNSITFTRGRAWKKNDSCYIEQKNWDVVRKTIGYARFETYAQLEIIKQIHNLQSIYQNYFQPSRKLISKKRVGAKVYKTYDTAQTPAQRVVSRKDTPLATKLRLRQMFHQLNPAQLQRDIQELVSELYQT
jgi:hypothetical protein